jgi:hypothetical protein
MMEGQGHPPVEQALRLAWSRFVTAKRRRKYPNQDWLFGRLPTGLESPCERQKSDLLNCYF